MKYTTKTRSVEAWQFVIPVGPAEDTPGWPEWLVLMENNGRVARMPDSSIHVYDQSGRLLPVPLHYWIVVDVADPTYLEVVAPDRFEAEYLAES